MDKELYIIRDEIVNRVLTISIFFIVPLHLAELIKVTEFSWDPVQTFFLFTTSTLVATWIFRRKVGLKSKFQVFSVVFILAGIGSVLQSGLMGAYIFFFIPSLLAVIVYGKKIGIYYCLITTFLFAIIGFGFSTGALQPLIQFDKYHSTASVWVTAVIGFLYFIMLIIFSSDKLYTHLINTLNDKTSALNQYQLGENRLQKIMDNMPAVVFLKDSNSVYRYTNTNFRATHDIELPIKGKSDFDIFTKEMAEQFRIDDKQVYQTGLPIKKENEFTINSSKRYFLTQKILLQAEGSEDELLGIGIDITEQKQLENELIQHKNNLEEKVEERTIKLASTNEELNARKSQLEKTIDQLKHTQSQLVHSEKMASLGVLSAGIAHEINNPLNFIQGGAHGLKGELTKDENNKTDINYLLNIIFEGVRRAKQIVQSLNRFSRSGDGEMTEFDVHEIIDHCLVMLNTKFKHKVKVHKNYCSQKSLILGNESKLFQLFLNVLTNAEQAIDVNGNIHIDTSIENTNLIIIIKDDGCGIMDEDLSKILDPFFTTKAPGEGTGLGLSITHNIIQEHGGEISIKSKFNLGTEVLIKIPVL